MIQRLPIHRRAAAILGLVISGIGFARECDGQEVGSEAWFKRTWTEASRWTPPAPLHIRASFEFHNYVDDVQLNTLRARPESAQSEADRKQLLRMEWEASHPLVQWTADVCTDGARLRYGCTDVAGRSGLHFALDKGTDWLLTEGTLRIAPSEIAKSEYGVRNYFDTADQIVRIAVWAGIGDSSPGGLQPTFSRLEGNRWEGGVSLAGVSPAVSLIRGRLAPEGLPSIAGMTIQSRTLADEKLRASVPLSTIEYVSWSANDLLGRFVVDQARWRDGQGRVVQTMRIEIIESLSPQQMDDLMRLPSPGITDAWGYGMNVHTVQDLRPDHLSQTKLENGVPMSVPLTLPLREESDSSRTQWFVSTIPVALGMSAILLAWGLRKLRPAVKGTSK